MLNWLLSPSCELGESSQLSLRWCGRGFYAARLWNELGISAISHWSDAGGGAGE